ncbi:MAG: DUF5682 family protein, partial [Bacteroidota bacterium]|nr:DUF5682 family protein [Bacteroidota bacterium]
MSEETLNVFGIRHLSPAGAYHLRKYLDEIKPEVVLIEGPSDANECAKYLTHSGTKPPVAILAYTTELPIHTILYPFASYSPEYQAFMWAEENNARAEFIDLPSDIMIAIENFSKDDHNDSKKKNESIEENNGKEEKEDKEEQNDGKKGNEDKEKQNKDKEEIEGKEEKEELDDG